METVKVDVKRIVERIDTALVKTIDVNKSGLIKQMDSQLVQSQKHSDVANVILRKVNGGVKAIEQVRKDMVKPLNDEVKRINAEFKTITNPIQQAKDDLSLRLMNWRAEQQRLQAEKEAKARAEEQKRIKISKAKGGTGEKTTPVEKPQDELKLRDTTRVRKVWHAEVTDITKVPAMYLQDEAVIDAVRKVVQRWLQDKVRQSKLFSPEDFKVPGVEIVQKEIPNY